MESTTVVSADGGAAITRLFCRAPAAQHSLMQTAGALEQAGYSESILQGNGGAWKEQQSLMQTVLVSPD
jgi:hypothetical protein